MHEIAHLWHLWFTWWAIHTGTYNEPGPYYGFFSGFGSDLGEVVLLGGVIGLYRKHNCHVTGCPRISHHKFTDQENGTEYMLCKKHYRKVHPEMPAELKIEHLLHIHERNQGNTYEH